ncbi:hypothetical protein OGAPHI_004356 [Ogataea philodendri]|uniref:Uncharacterized protein n=1 Tax=Ogataea philodendri TaxID=1378263 RepID=A0A9P8P6I4_9ASCO|nr:uncharacterized protein OGAPHI_004356 [Ogataea philodendri]KAH3666167.1 hypothetical protein OGAPHI_004356 [Ogataea philodendri]
MSSLELGITKWPGAWTSHSPPKILNSDDFPHPLGPMIKRLSPDLIVNVKSCTRTVPVGVTKGTFWNEISSPYETFGPFTRGLTFVAVSTAESLSKELLISVNACSNSLILSL